MGWGGQLSTEALIRLRKSGSMPAAVWIVIGECPDRLRDLPDCIHIKTTDKPANMDWRAVMGLHVDIFDMADNETLLLETINAIEAAQPKALGIACKAEVMGLSKEHEGAMWLIWRHLGNTL